MKKEDYEEGRPSNKERIEATFLVFLPGLTHAEMIPCLSVVELSLIHI